jgi:hypothetical protein
MADEREFKILITGDAGGIVDASRQSSSALKEVAGSAGGEAAPALDKLGQRMEEGGRSAEHAGISHRGLHMIFRQVGEASKGLEIGLMALTGVMTGSLMFGVYAVIAGVQAMIAHFEKQKAVVLEAAKATVQFWTDALQGSADARTAAEDYVKALKKITESYDPLIAKETEEEAVLKRVLALRLAILKAAQQAALAGAAGDKEEQGRINARYGQRAADIEIENEQAEIELKKRHLAEQQAVAMGKEQAATAAEKAKEAGAPGREEASAAEGRLPKLKEELATLQAARMKPEDLAALKLKVADDVEQFKKGGVGAFGEAVLGNAQARADQLTKAQRAEQAYAAAQQEYEQSQGDIDRFKSGTAALAKAVEDATAEFAKALQAARGTYAEVGKAEAVHQVNVEGAATIRGIKEGEVIQAAGVPDNALSRNVLADIQAMEGAGQGQKMNAGQTEMVNHLVAGLRAQGTSQERINALLLEMKDLHVSQADKLQDIWQHLSKLKQQVHSLARNPG